MASDRLAEVWSAQVNDLVGGWVVTSYPHPLSQHDHRRPTEGGDPMKCGYVVAECITEDDAQTIAGLLNEADYLPALSGETDERFKRALWPETII